MEVTIDDLQARARRRLPRALYDYIEGGAEDERTLAANRSAFDRHTLEPRVLVDVSGCDQSVRVLGEIHSTPMVIAPTGFTGMFWPDGEIAGARAAGARGLTFTISTMSICSMEQIAKGAPDTKLWFQLYVWRDRGIAAELIQRARAIGCTALVVTVDVAVIGQRERDIRNGLIVPPRITAGTIVDALRHPAWLWGVVRNPKMTFGNFAGMANVKTNPVSLAEFTTRQFTPALSWRDLDWLRAQWGGPVIVKGIMGAADARRAAEEGIEAIVVSNHGGRQCDCLRGSLEVLPEVVDAVGDDLEVLFDGGIRRGTDIVKAIALGARAVMIGKAYNYGVAANGEAGATRAIEILQKEIDRTLALIGRPVLRTLDATALRGRQAVGATAVV